MKNQKITPQTSANEKGTREISVSLTVHTFGEHGFKQRLTANAWKMGGKRAQRQYPEIQTLKLTRKQQAAFLAFTNSLLK